MFKFHKGDCQSNQLVHDHITRQHQRLHLPFFRTNFCQRSFRYKGAIIWNHISTNISINFSIYTIKKHLKFYILHNSLDHL